VSCEEDEEADMEPERQNVLVHFENNSGDPQQIRNIQVGKFYPVVFPVSYRDIQVDLSPGPDRTGFLVLNVENGSERE
jgi:hypothetical protein